MSNLVVDVTVVNNSNQTASLRFPADSELPDYLKSLARREDLKEVTVSDPYDDEGSAPAKPKRGRGRARTAAAGDPDAGNGGD